MRDDAVLRHALPLGRGLGRESYQTIDCTGTDKNMQLNQTELKPGLVDSCNVNE